MELDALDRGILALLREDARRSLRSLARELGSSTPTVSARLRELESAGLVRGYHADVAEEALGTRVAWALVRASPAHADGVVAALADRPWVDEVRRLAAGRVLVRLRLTADGPGLADADAVLAALPGVLDYEVHEQLAAHRGRASATTAPGMRLRCHQCGRAIAGEGLVARLGGRRHVFCCVVCRDTFTQRFRKTVAGRDAGAGG